MRWSENVPRKLVLDWAGSAQPSTLLSTTLRNQIPRQNLVVGTDSEVTQIQLKRACTAEGILMNSSKFVLFKLYEPLAFAIVFGVTGFFLGNLTNGPSAREAARLLAHDAMITALVPTCLALSLSDTERIAKLQAINGAELFLRRDAMRRSGWATVPGSEIASSDLAAACLYFLDFAPLRNPINNSAGTE